MPYNSPMSETPTPYHTSNELEIALKDLERMLREVTENPDASIWLRKAIAELWQRDSIQVLEDLAILQTLLQAKKKSDLLMLGCWAEVPFCPQIPNAETRKAMEEARTITKARFDSQQDLLLDALDRE